MTTEDARQLILMLIQDLRPEVHDDAKLIELNFGCPLADSDHWDVWRVHAHVGHEPNAICLCHDFEGLPDPCKIGILLHEYGHLFGGNSDAEADLWVEEELGIDLDYVETLQWVHPDELR